MRLAFASPLLLALGLLAPPATAEPTAAAGGTFEDRAIGFAMKSPGNWNEVPLPTGEIWTIAKWASKKVDREYSKEAGGMLTFEPALQVVAFIDEYIEGFYEDASEDVVKGDKTISFKFRVDPYKDYEDFITRTLKGFTFTDERSHDHDGIPVTIFEMEIGNYAVKPVKAVTWVYRTEVGSVALQFTCLASKYKKYKSLMDRTFDSFKTIERTEDFDFESANNTQFTSSFALEALDPAQRKLQLQERERIAWQQATETVVDGWTAERIKGYGVLNACDKKMAKRVVSYIEGVTNWLDETFPEIGPDQYVRKPIIRICRDEAERDNFWRGQTRYYVTNPEVTTYKGDSGPSGGPWFDVNQQTFENWFRDRDRRTYAGLPAFMQVGTTYLVGFAKPKGKSLDFPLSFVEGYLKGELKRGSGHSTLRELMTMSTSDFNKGDRNFRIGESLILMRFLTEGGRNKREKEILGEYVTNLKDVIREINAELDTEKEDAKEPENEEEENELAQKRAEDVRKKEARILNETFERTFGSWSDAQWKSFEKSFDDCF